MKKNKTDNKILFIDASAESVRHGNKNKLSEGNLNRILQAHIDRKEEGEEYFSRLVPHAEVAENAYNLSISSYVEKEDTREVIDITELNARIAGIVQRQQVLRTEIDAIVAELESSPA